MALTARAVAVAGPGKHADGAGMFLHVSNTGTRTYRLKFHWRAKSLIVLGRAEDLTCTPPARRHERPAPVFARDMTQ